MKRIFKAISLSLVMVFSFIIVAGCSCSKNVNVKYSVNVTNSDGSEPTVEMQVQALITKKLREPASTPCYKKNSDGKLELIENASEVYECYDSEGNSFEKATYNKKENEVVDEKYPIYYDTINNTYSYSYESEVISLKNTDKYPITYKFTIKNRSSEKIYIKTITIEEIFNNLVKGDVLKELVYEEPTTKVSRSETECYEIEGREEASFTIVLKNISKDSFVSKKTKELIINIPLVIYK